MQNSGVHQLCWCWSFASAPQKSVSHRELSTRGSKVRRFESSRLTTYGILRNLQPSNLQQFRGAPEDLLRYPPSLLGSAHEPETVYHKRPDLSRGEAFLMIVPSTTPAHQTGWYRLTAMTPGMVRPSSYLPRLSPVGAVFDPPRINGYNRSIVWRRRSTVLAHG